jgi:hypothetical protein
MSRNLYLNFLSPNNQRRPLKILDFTLTSGVEIQTALACCPVVGVVQMKHIYGLFLVKDWKLTEVPTCVLRQVFH